MGLKRIVTADWIFPVTSPAVAGGALLVEDGTVLDIGPAKNIIDRHPHLPVTGLPPGAVMPGLVNAHAHLWLASSKRLPAEDGFAAWLGRCIEAKESFSTDRIRRGIRLAVETLKRRGTVFVADLSKDMLAAAELARAGLGALVFRELIGHDPALIEEAEREWKEEKTGHPHFPVVVPTCHAPYTAGPDLLRATARLAAERDVPWTLHLAESEDETELFLEGRGPLFDLLATRIPKELIPGPGVRPISWLDSMGCLDSRLIAVHLVQADEKEIALLARRGVRACICPSSNIHLTGKLPRVSAMLDTGLRPALGTDSPASAESLNLFREMEILLEHGFDADMILPMATLHGTEALDLPRSFGRIEKGESPALVHTAFDTERRGGERCDEKTRDPAAGRRAAADAIRAGARGRVTRLDGDFGESE